MLSARIGKRQINVMLIVIQLKRYKMRLAIYKNSRLISYEDIDNCFIINSNAGGQNKKKDKSICDSFD